MELIGDGIHVHPSVVRATFSMFGAKRVVLISDSMEATGKPDGTYALGGQEVFKKGNLATLADGTLAGSVTNLFDCMKSVIAMGVPQEAAIRAATINPARSVGIDGLVGSLDTGKRADILVCDKALNLQRVIASGVERKG
ncbi:MAG: amidohydrolase family protein [Clostridia bacterium]|nr:amidohydrolase family protein [Clostridia bacterium]